jgi:hypothetical protein
MERRGFFGTLGALLTLGFLPRAKAKHVNVPCTKAFAAIGDMQFARIQRVGKNPAPGHQWQNTTSNFWINTEVGDMVPRLRQNTFQCQESIVKLMAENFRTKTGPLANPDDWMLVVLDGWWMRATEDVKDVHVDGEAKTTRIHSVFIVCTYAFVPKKDLNA